jgi:peroxiredoxin/predicted small secreted protein
MGSASLFRFLLLLLLVLSPALLAGCNGVGEDLVPSGTDRRPPVVAGTTGPAVGQIAPDFTLADTLGDNVTLSATLAVRRGAVLYFTMWCPICDAHMSHMRSAVMPAHPDVAFFAIDYVSGSVTDARASEIANGYANSGFTVLVDLGNPVLHAYAATMGTTVVVDNAGIVRMNEDYGSGAQLQAVLGGLP